MSSSIYADPQPQGDDSEQPAVISSLEVAADADSGVIEAEEVSAEPTEPVDSPATPEEPQPTPRRSRRKLVLVGLALAGLAGWWFRGGSNSLSEDLAYLPDSPVLVLQCRVERIENSPLLEELRPILENAVQQVPAGGSDLLNEFAGAFDTITIGIAAPPSASQPNDSAASGVLHCLRDFVIQESVPAAMRSQLKEEQIAGQTVFFHEDAGFCQIDPRTIAIGNPRGIRALVNRGFEPATLSDPMQAALGQADFAAALTVVAAGPMESAQQLKQFLNVEPPDSIVLTTDLDTDLEISASVTMQTAADVEAIRARAEPMLALAKLQGPQAASFVDALEFSVSGTTLSVAASIPGESLVQAAKQSAPQLAGMQLPTVPRIRGAQNASAQMCAHHMAAMNAAIERYYFDVGEWPTAIDQLTKYAPESPHFCAAHQMHYAIDPGTHRITETPNAVAETSNTLDLEPAESPRRAFENVTLAAQAGDVGQLLDGFTEAGRSDIAADLVASAEQAVALQVHQSPEVAKLFRKLQTEQSPEFQTESSDAPTLTALAYLTNVAKFMDEHGIEFTSLGAIYEPCVLGDVVTENNWAIGRVTYDKDGVVSETTLGFLRDSGNWRICVMSEIPDEALRRLEEGLIPAS